MNILLICNGGVSTSMLCASMRKHMGIEDSITAAHFGQACERQFDVVLVAPQVASLKSRIEKDFPDCVVAVIPQAAYGKMDGAAVVEYVRSLKPNDKRTTRKEELPMKHLKITLACNGGVSTKMLCTKIIAAGKEKGYEVESDAFSMMMLDEKAGGSDVILVGPQIKAMAPKIRSLFPDIPVDVIEMRDYGTMNGAKIFDELCAKYNF